MNIICPKDQLAEFRRECRKKFPNEHFAALYGHRSDEGNLLITRIAPVSHESDAAGVDVSGRHIILSKKAALRQESDWIGTIHSHCSAPNDECCEHLSPLDLKSAVQWGEAVCGVVFVDSLGTRTSVHWYVPQPIPSVIYC